MSVTPFIAAQMPANTSSMAARVRKYLAADPERDPDHQDAADEAHPPELVEGRLHERLNHPQHGDE
jgi:hypothetical protein